MPKWEKIIFVCTGNSCRSPMAEAIAKKEALRRLLDIEISSAGTNPSPYGRASANAAAVCAEIGLDISKHRCKSVFDTEYDEKTLFVTMQQKHRDIMLVHTEIPPEQIIVLGGGIPDPYGSDIGIYRICRDVIALSVRELFEALEQEQQKNDKVTECTLFDMTADDLDEVCSIESACFADSWSRQSFAEEIENPPAIFIIAREGEEIAGYGGAIIAADSAEIPKVCVRPESRRRGIAGKIVRRLCEAAREKGANEISLEVRASNEAAIKLYESVGFEKVGKRPNFYSSPTEDAYIMTYKLV